MGIHKNHDDDTHHSFKKHANMRTVSNCVVKYEQSKLSLSSPVVPQI
jgi:hypothetical protein